MSVYSYTVFETKMGWIGIMASDRGITGTTLPRPTPEEALISLGSKVRGADKDVRRLLDPIKRLSDYFEGKKVEFPDVLELNGSTPFQRRVWEATRRIPYGETRTYGEMAREAGSPLAARAAGQALGANPFPIIVPCHRVVARDGGLGGFGGGLEMKEKLLKMEGVKRKSEALNPKSETIGHVRLRRVP